MTRRNQILAPKLLMAANQVLAGGIVILNLIMVGMVMDHNLMELIPGHKIITSDRTIITNRIVIIIIKNLVPAIKINSAKKITLAMELVQIYRQVKHLLKVPLMKVHSRADLHHPRVRS